MRKRLFRVVDGARRMQRREGGFAVPTVLLMLMAMMAVVGVGVAASIQTQSGTVRDQQSKSAFSVAESGAQSALLAFNRVPPGGNNPCSPIGSTVGSGGWCLPMTGSLNDGTFTYWAHPPPIGNTANQALEIVAQGSRNDVTRRVDVTAHSSSGQQMFSSASVLAQTGIVLDSNAEIRSAVATNGDITVASEAMLCGQASVGIGQELSGDGGYFSDQGCTVPETQVIEQELFLPPVNQGDAATNNDNGRFFAQDPVSGNRNNACWNGVKANGGNGFCGARHLELGSNSNVTLTGSVYSFCKLTLSSNSSLYIAAGVHPIIYFDSPEACGYSAGATQLEIASNARITPASGAPSAVAMLFVGSATIPTNILLNSNTEVETCDQNFVVYAPRTDIEMNSESRFCGAVGAKSIHIDQNAIVRVSAEAQSFILPNTAAHYEIDNFIECSVASASPPDAGC